MSERQYLKPLESKVRPRELASIDLEGDGGERGFISAAICYDGDYRLYRSRDLLLSDLLSRRFRNVHVYAHNLTYDFGMLLPHLRVDFDAFMIRGRVFKVRFRLPGKNYVYLNDSLGMYAGLSLADVGDAIGLSKFPTPPAFVSESEHVPEWRCEVHDRLWCEECYNIRDTLIVQRAMEMLQDQVNLDGVSMYNTLPATSMAYWRTHHLDDEFLTPFQYRNDFARLGYMGGRVESYNLGVWGDVNVYDVRSLYPSVMSTGALPHPNYMRGPKENDRWSIIEDYEGLSEVEIVAPDMPIPILPYRAGGKLYFPTGRLQGVWTHAELRYAISNGYTPVSVFRSLYSVKQCWPFKSFVDSLYGRRRILDDAGDPRQLIYKIMLNSLYGKFGQRSDGGLERLLPISAYFEDQNKEGYDFIEFEGEVFARKAVPTFRQPSYINVLWASYITAYARIRLHQIMRSVDYDVLYCDTDSIFTHHELEVGGGLGELQLEHRNCTVDLIAPKVYRLILSDGEVVTRAKGVPKAAQDLYALHHVATYDKPLGILEASRRKLTPSQWVRMVKHLHNRDPKRVYTDLDRFGSKNSTSRPLDVSLLRPEALPLSVSPA